VKSTEFQYELERKIDLYICGRLNQEQIDALWVEMIQHPDSYEYLKTSVALKRTTQSRVLTDLAAYPGSSTLKQTKSSNQRNWKQYAAAAAIVVSTGVGGAYFITSGSDQPLSGELKPFDKLELVAYRSSSNNQVISDTRLELKKAVDTALMGNPSEALIALNRILESTDDNLIKAEAYLNIGILEYNSNEFNSASMSFKNAAQLSFDNELLYERVIWNLAHAQMAAGDESNARISIEKVVSLDGAHSRAAKSYLDFMK
jgi:tetratricopeptide (TPR) repeat protein